MATAVSLEVQDNNWFANPSSLLSRPLCLFVLFVCSFCAVHQTQGFSMLGQSSATESQPLTAGFSAGDLPLSYISRVSTPLKRTHYSSFGCTSGHTFQGFKRMSKCIRSSQLILDPSFLCSNLSPAMCCWTSSNLATRDLSCTAVKGGSE